MAIGVVDKAQKVKLKQAFWEMPPFYIILLDHSKTFTKCQCSKKWVSYSYVLKSELSALADNFMSQVQTKHGCEASSAVIGLSWIH